jgi:DNA helicase II / ATP-dependent DNA helicase PcrA
LEWSHVYLVGCSEGLLPLESNGVELDEERRLAYVGITRARDALHISWARARRSDGPAERICSRFFRGADVWGSSISANVAITSVSVRQQTGPAACRVCGRALSTPNERTLLRCDACPSQVDEVLREVLVDWRHGVAIQRGLPIFQVLTDQAIQAIAEHPPRNEAELRAIPGTRWLGEHVPAVLALVGEAGYPLLED